MSRKRRLSRSKSRSRRLKMSKKAQTASLAAVAALIGGYLIATKFMDSDKDTKRKKRIFKDFLKGNRSFTHTDPKNDDLDDGDKDLDELNKAKIPTFEQGRRRRYRRRLKR